jgi:hypothetical protein
VAIAEVNLEDELRPLQEIRREARRLLREDRASQSLIDSLKFSGLFFAALCGFGGLLSALQGFSVAWLYAFLAALVAGVLCSFAFYEWMRLARLREILEELLRGERSYEILLADARSEREQVLKEKRELQVQLALFQGVGAVLSRFDSARNPTTDATDVMDAKVRK